jgi:hypothetical protein
MALAPIVIMNIDMPGPLEANFEFDAQELISGLTAHVTLVGIERANFRLKVGMFFLWIGFKIAGMNVEYEGI